MIICKLTYSTNSMSAGLHPYQSIQISITIMLWQELRLLKSILQVPHNALIFFWRSNNP